jgi:hypothetical protein
LSKRRVCDSEDKGARAREAEGGVTSTGVVYESPTFEVVEEMETVTA